MGAKVLLCAGGSSTRVLEAFLHICAAGLGPDRVLIQAIDPDGSNGSFSRTKELAHSYLLCRNHFAGRMGDDVPFFRTELDLLSTDKDRQELGVWNPLQARERLRDILNVDGLLASDTPSELVRLFFSRRELDLELDQGYRGRTAIGAAAMALLPEHAGELPWSAILKELADGLAAGDARVFVSASVFGGTGASAIPVLARFLREALPPRTLNVDRLRIALGALVPYFRFTETSAASGELLREMAARSEWFALATRGAVEFYDHLRENNELPYDATFWTGDSSPVEVAYAPGGPAQRNRPHFVDLLQAFACTEMFVAPLDTFRGHYYSGPRPDVEPQLGDATLLDWPDIPLKYLDRETVRRRLLRFLLAGAVHLGFGEPLLLGREIDRRPYCVPWYYRRHAKQKDWFSHASNRAALDALTQYFGSYCFPWWEQVLDIDQQRVRLVNRAAITGSGSGRAAVTLNRLANLLGPDEPGDATFDSLDAFHRHMVTAPSRRGGHKGGGGYLGLLAYGADRFITQKYQIG